MSGNYERVYWPEDEVLSGQVVSPGSRERTKSAVGAWWSSGVTGDSAARVRSTPFHRLPRRNENQFGCHWLLDAAALCAEWRAICAAERALSLAKLISTAKKESSTAAGTDFRRQNCSGMQIAITGNQTEWKFCFDS